MITNNADIKNDDDLCLLIHGFPAQVRQMVAAMMVSAADATIEMVAYESTQSERFSDKREIDKVFANLYENNRIMHEELIDDFAHTLKRALKLIQARATVNAVKYDADGSIVDVDVSLDFPNIDHNWFLEPEKSVAV